MPWYKCVTCCAECTYLDPSKTDGKLYYCEKLGKGVSACRVSCDRATYAFSRDDSLIKDLKESSKGCYIATMVCNALNEEKSLENLKKLRYDVMENDKQYSNTLVLYDFVGPTIVSNINNEENKLQIVSNLYNLCIEKVSKLIELNKKTEAIKLYKDMVNLLVQGYGITDEKGKTIVLK